MLGTISLAEYQSDKQLCAVVLPPCHESVFNNHYIIIPRQFYHTCTCHRLFINWHITPQIICWNLSSSVYCIHVTLKQVPITPHYLRTGWTNESCFKGWFFVTHYLTGSACPMLWINNCLCWQIDLPKSLCCHVEFYPCIPLQMQDTVPVTVPIVHTVWSKMLPGTVQHDHGHTLGLQAQPICRWCHLPQLQALHESAQEVQDCNCCQTKMRWFACSVSIASGQ